MFAARGFEGASTREIAARAGVNISSLHYHWESKETLYFAVFRNIFDRIVDLLRNTLAPLLAQRRRARAGDRRSPCAALFDFFADNPNVPKLLMRRIVENEDIDVGIERDILVPAWARLLGVARPPRAPSAPGRRVAALHAVGALGAARLPARQPLLSEPARRQRPHAAAARAACASTSSRLVHRLLGRLRAMRALITASFDAAALARLARHMEVVHEDWKVRQSIYFDGAAVRARASARWAPTCSSSRPTSSTPRCSTTCPLRMIGCCRGDPVNIDLELATRKGIPVFHTPGRNADAVADLTLAFMLMLARQLPAIARHLSRRRRRPRRERGRLPEALHALHGRRARRPHGRARRPRRGRARGGGAARRLQGARPRLRSLRAPTPPPGRRRSCALDALLREADFVSLHAPVTPETQNLLSRERLALMKPTAYLVNTARAALTDEDALYDMLRDGRLAGAALDVLAEEPLRPGNRFLALPNVDRDAAHRRRHRRRDAPPERHHRRRDRAPSPRRAPALDREPGGARRAAAERRWTALVTLDAGHRLRALRRLRPPRAGRSPRRRSRFTTASSATRTCRSCAASTSTRRRSGASLARCARAVARGVCRRARRSAA